MRNQKGISLIAIIIIVAIVIIGIIIISNSGDYKFDDKEGLAYANLRWACSKTALGDVDNIGTITREQFDTLGKMVKKENGQWFSDVKKVITVKTNDISDDEQVVTIEYNGYVATFTVDHPNAGTYYLTDYKFEQKKASGYIVMIED